MAKLIPWLQLFRAQTAPATVIIIMLPYLMAAELFSPLALGLIIYCIFLHWFSFGHNSLMDTAMRYDTKDPAKSHHPLVSGTLALGTAHNVIHWGLAALACIGAIITLQLSPQPFAALTALFLCYAFGHVYNDGVSKESTLSFISIALCFTAAAAWGYFLAHKSVKVIFSFLMAYIFLGIAFQIGWSGHLKELELRERSNLLSLMGARVIRKGERKVFEVGNAWLFGCMLKLGALAFLWTLLFYLYPSLNPLNIFNPFAAQPLQLLQVLAFLWLLLGSATTLILLWKLLRSREFKRELELQNMSLMEIISIYLPLPLLLPIAEAVVLMAFGLLYFFALNKFLWKVPYPKV